MKKLKLFFACLLMAVLSIGQMWAKDVSITSFTALSGSIDSNISYSSAKGNGTNDPIISSNWLRIYKPASGKSDGGYITVTAANGYEITSITFTNANDKATAYKYSVDGGSLSSSTSIAKSGTFTYNTTTFSTFNFYNSGSERLSVASIAVTYQATGGGGGGSNNPTVSADPEEVTDVVAAGVNNQSISLSYDNISGYTTEVSVHPNANGTGTLSPAWLSASISSPYSTVTYTVDENTGNARTAYIKVRATAAGNKEATTIIPISQVKYTEPTGTFNKFTGTTLPDGFYIICSGATTTAMKNEVKSSRLDVATVTISNNTTITNPDESVIWKLENLSGDNAGYFTLYNEAVEKYAAFTSSNGNANLIASVTDYARFNHVSETSYEFQNKGKTGKNLRYNSGYGFASYSTQTGATLTLYKKALPTHKVTFTAAPTGGTVAVSVGGSSINTNADVEEGSTVTITPTPSSHYKIASVTKGGVAISPVNNVYSFTMPTSDVAIAVTFELIPVTAVTLNKSATSLVVGATETLSVSSVTPDGASNTVTWSSTDETVATVTNAGVVTAVKAGSATIKATSTVSTSVYGSCALTVTAPSGNPITISQTTGGTVTANVADVTDVVAGTSVTLTATPADGYSFGSWTVLDDNLDNITPTAQSGNTFTFDMPDGEVLAEASFTHEEAVLKLHDANGESTFDSEHTHYWKESVNLPDDAAECSKTFMGWSADANRSTAPEIAKGASYTIPNKGTNRLYAVYATIENDDVTITPSAVSDGDDPHTITIDQAGYTLSANKNSGSTAPAWNSTASDVRIYAKGDITLTSSKTIKSIVFNLSTQGLKRLAPITASVGTIATQASGDETVTWTGSATSVTFTVGDNAEYGSDGASKAGQLDFSTIDVVAEGEPSGYSTTCVVCNKVTLQKVIAGEGAEAAGNAIAFSPASTTVKTCEAAEITVNPTIATGWELTSVVPTGVAGVTYDEGVISIPQGKEGTLTVTATFSQKNYSIAVQTYPAGIGAQLEGATSTAKYNEVQTISTNQPTGYLFGGWYIYDAEDTGKETDLSSELFTGTYAGGDLELEASFLMPDKNLVAEAYFDELHNVAWAIENTPSSGKSEEVYVKGIVTGITEISTEHGNATYYISDLDENGAAANSYLVFRAKKEGNTDYTSNTQLKEGDEVIVYGKLTTYQGTKEFDQGGYIITNGRTAATFNVVVSGTADKTDYYASETFAYAGLTAKAEYNTGYKKNVTTAAIWKANNAASYTVTADETINVTATWNETTSENYPVAVTVTTKVLESIELSETALAGYKGIALPKPTTVTAHFDDQGVKSTQNVTAFAVYDEAGNYDASSTNAQTIQVKYSFGLNTRTADYTVTLSPVRNTLEMAYTIAKGREIIDVDNIEGNNLALAESANKVFVAGLVTAVSSSTYTIKDNAAGEAFIEIKNGTLGSGISSVVVGDRIKVEGNLYFYENNTHTVQKYQITNGQVVAVVRTPEFSIADVAEMEVNITADLAEDDLTIERGGSEGAITFSCTDPAVTIVGNKLHATAEGNATVTATMAANGEGAMSYGEATATFNVHVIAERQRYAVSFDGNEADGGTAPTIANQLPGVPVDLPANTFTKTDMRFTSWVVTNNSTSEVIAQEDGHFTMPAAPVTLTAQWEAKTYCALTLRINGVDQDPFNVERLEANDLSEHNPETTNGYDFYGWAVLDSDVEDEVTEAIAILPNHIFTPAADEESKTLYAVFKKAEEGGDVTDEITYANLEATSTTYEDFEGVTITSNAVYAGNSAAGNSSIQLRSDKSSAGIVSSASAGKITKVAVVWNSNTTSGRKIGVYASNTAYENATDLYGSVSSLGTIDYESTTEFEIEDEYAYVGIRSTSGALYLDKVSFTWSSSATYYTTRPVVRHMVTYDANGGTNAPAAAKTDVNSKVTVTSETPTAPENTVFYCWSANEDGTGAIYWAGDKVAASEADVTIYAVWRALPAPAEDGISAIGGKFIISNLGDTAVFSRGNLQHQMSTNTWRCAPNQYDWAGEAANEQIGNLAYEGWVDLFCWSMGNENNYGATSAYHSADYYNKNFVDWGGLFDGEWATLSSTQWKYLLNSRSGANDKWGMAMIGDNLGMILLPEEWTAPAGITFVPRTNPTSDLWDTNDYLVPGDRDHCRVKAENMPANKFTMDEWAQLEAAGAIFLPYAGRRSGGYGNHTNRLDEEVNYEYNYTYYENYLGTYWTSTMSNPEEGKADYVYTLNCKKVNNEDVYSWGKAVVWGESGRYGQSVRLVHIIPRQYTVTYDANGATSGSVPVNGKTYQDGDTVHVAAKGDLAKEGYAFAGWKFKGVTYKAGETYTISNVLYNEEIVFEAQWSEPSEYVLVTKATQLAAGDQIIIAAAGNYDFAMGTQNGDIRNRVEIAKTEDKKRICLLAEDPVVFTLGVSGDYFTFNDGTGYLCATTGSNKIGTQTDLNDNGKWDISVSTDANGVVKASVVAQGSLTNKTLQYNSGSPRFSCYSTASLQAVALYKIPGEVEVNNKNIGTEDIAQNSTVTLDNGTMTVNESKELDDLTLGLHAVVDVEEGKTLETKDLTIKSTAGESTQMTGVVENVTYSNFYLEITFYNSAATLDAAAANQWYMISAPFDVALNGGFFQTDGTPMVFGQDFDLFEYDGEKRANTGVTGWARPQGVMHGGHACLIGFNEGQSTTIRLKATTTELSNPTSITLNTYSGDAANSNWNGVANPSMRHIDVDQMVYVYNNDEGENGRKYLTYSADQMSYVVGRAFFVQNTGSMAIGDASHDVLYAPKREAANTYSYCVRIARNEASQWADQIFVRASEDATNEYKQGRDMSAMNGTSASTALLWTNNYGTRLTVEEAPLINDQASYELGLYSPKNGEYRIEVASPKEDADLYLTREGAIIWNLSESAYTIDLNKGVNTGYGLLLKAKMPQTPTGIENGGMLNGANGVQKVIIDENVFILRGGQMYDVTGKMVK